ncbi:MAG TPA: SRPBCC family protein [Mycobacteriales bacterium]|nr:SRPBCC family protein [Mycobacteriales bacterium]
MADRPPVELRVAVPVAAPVGQTWAALTDWRRQGEWMLGTRVQPVGGDGTGVGGRLHAVTGFGRLGVVDDMVITDWEPPAVCRVRHVGRLIRGTGAFEVAARPGGSTLIWSEWLDLPLGAAGRLGWKLVRPGFRWGLDRSLRRFASWAEHYQPAGPTR